MTLKTRIRIVLVASFLLIEIFQCLVIRTLLVNYPHYYIIPLFLLGTTLLFCALIILYIDINVFSRFNYIERIIATIAKLQGGLAGYEGTGKDEISKLTDYIFGVREELQKSKDDLQHSRTILAKAQKFASVGSWDFDLKTGKVRCSDEMCKITGVDPAHISSDYAFTANLIHPEYRQSVKDTLQAALRGKEFCVLDYRAVLPGGSQRTLHVEGDVQYNSDNQLFRITGVLYDATRQRILEDLKSVNKEKGFGILDIHPNPVLIIDNHKVVQYVNKAFEEKTGYLARDVLGTEPPYPWWPADSYDQCAGGLEREMSGRTRKSQCVYKKKNGRNIWFERTTRIIEKEDKSVYNFFVYLVDITEQKRLKKNMEYYISEITQAQEVERKRISLQIHDEIIQSLASLCLEVDALGKDRNKLRDDLPALLTNLRDGLQEMADKLRKFSHELHPSIIDQGIVPALENLTQEISSGTEIDVKIAVSGREQPLPVETELSLFRIAQEAIRNAVKHSGVKEASIRLKYSPKTVRLTISDNGIGFNLPEVLEDYASQRKLGIIGMQERAHLIEGKFTLRSRVGKGTVAMVEAPVIK